MPQQEMMFSDYLRVIAKHKWSVLIITLVVLLSTYHWASKKQSEYKSDARIKIQRMQTFAGLFDEMMVSSGDPIENYVFEIRGDQVMEEAARKLTASGEPTSASDLARAMTVKRIERTDLIDISIKGFSEKTAQSRCIAIVEAFRTVHDTMVEINARSEFEEIKKSLSNTVANLTQIDEEMKKMIGETIASEKGTDPDEEIKVLSARLADASLKLQTLREEGNYTEDYAEIVAQKTVIRIIQERIKDASDKYQKAKAAFEEQERKQASATREYEQKRKILEEMVGYLTKKYEEARIALTKKMEHVVIVENASKGILITTEKAYLTAIGALLGLMLGVVFAFVAENLDTSIRTLVEIEETFHLPILGVIPHFSPNDQDIPLRPEKLIDRIRYSEVVNSMIIIWKGLASILPGAKNREQTAATRSGMLIVPFSPRAPATEGYRAVRTNLLMTAGEKKMGALILTSPGPAEGKSTTISNLACSFAQGGKRTLLVSANMRRPSLYRTFGLNRERGLAEILVGELSWREVIKDHRDLAIGERAGEGIATSPGIENLYFITCGGRTLQPAEWLAQPLFEAMVREWGAEYDVVLIDGPPVLPVPDSVIMSSAVGNVALVYQSGSTQRDSMLRAISLINKTGATIKGLILNDLHAKWGAGPDYFHYRGYYGRPEK